MKISGQEIAYAGVRELQALYLDGSCSPVDVAQIVLERLERLQPKISGET